MSATVALRFEASLGDYLFEVVSIRTDFSRRLDVYTPERGDGADSFDRGRVVRRDQLEIVFTGTAEGVADLLGGLRELYDTGGVRVFTHPVDGSWPARLGSLNISISSGAVTGSVEIVETTTPLADADNVTDPDFEFTVQDLAVEADLADQALIAVGEEPVATTTVSEAFGWTEETSSASRETLIEQSRSVLLDIRSRYRALPACAENLAAVHGLTRVQGGLQRLSDTLGQGGWQLRDVTVGSTGRLRDVIAGLYGPEAVESGVVDDVLAQVAAVNGLRDIASLSSGLLLQVPTRESLGLPGRSR